ncbi:MAG: M14 family metallopeptidase [Suipraeoptans sp.]
MKLRLRESLSFEERRIAVQTALTLGFCSEFATFPVASLTEGIDLPKTGKEIQDLMKQLLPKSNEVEGYVASSDSARVIEDFDWRRERGLERLFSKGEFLKDNNNDLLPDLLNFHIVLNNDCSTSQLIAACNFAFRFGMEVTAIDKWILSDSYNSGNAIIFSISKSCGIDLEEKQGYSIVTVRGDGSELEEFSAVFCEKFPLITGFESWTRKLQDMTDSLALQNLDGQLAYINALTTDREINSFVSPEINERKVEVEELFPKTKFKNYKSMKKVYEKEYDIAWEVDEFRQLLEKYVYPIIKEGDSVEIIGALSEERDIRGELEEEINNKLSGVNVHEIKSNIYCAYKQGYSWIEESILPKLESFDDIDCITVAFKAFLPEGITKWNDEDGATPSYNNINEEDPDKWYDLPIRYLQELYPIEDTIIRQLGIGREQVVFTDYKGDKDVTYIVSAIDSQGKEILRSEYKAIYSERPYLNDFKGLGKVHPSTGYLEVLVNGKEVLNQRIKTDVEAIWDIYQDSVLRDLREFVEEKGAISAKEQPFFSRLLINVEASEPDYLLPSRNDMISVLDALHEDMYFAASDYFKNFGLETCGEMLDEPGLILPIINKGIGKPKFSVTLYDQLAKEPQIIIGDNDILPHPKKEDISLYISKVDYLNEEMSITINCRGVDEQVAESYTELIGNGTVQRGACFGNAEQITIATENCDYMVRTPRMDTIKKDLCIEDINIYEREVIGYDQYIEVIEQLKRVPGIDVYQIAESYLGRKLYAVELLPKNDGYVSRTKRITNHPSEIINCRHHANEVSSTNAAFLLIRTLLTNPKYAQVQEKLNLVIVPMENVDGSAIHYELQKENPHWKLHVARFNAVGKEFYHEHFKYNTKHTEAMGLTRLFETFVPDIIVDNHGVPTHEWEQQFAGYTSPSYKGFWLPRSLLYGYFWYVSDEEYKSNYTVNKVMEYVIADAVAENEDMKKWNEDWAAQFEKYAHKWMPKLFPADYYKEMINYWIPFKADMNHRYPSIKFPWITTVAYTSEVADETAQGDYLNLCARAHVTHDIATIEMLINAECVYENKLEIKENKVDISYTRKRPIVVQLKGKKEGGI